MKKYFFLGIMLCLATLAFAQRSMDWYTYWGSNTAGSQIEPQRMTVDNDGNIYIVALFGGNKVNVEGTTLLSGSAMDKGDAVIVKMSPSKSVLWTYTLVNTGRATAADIALDKNGNVFVLGTFTKSVKVGTTTMALDDSNFGEEAIYVIKLTSAGSAVKAWQISATGAKAGKIAVDSQDNVIITGLLDGDATFVTGGEAEGDFNNAAQLFVAKYDNNGNLLWHEFRNDNGQAIYGLSSVAVDANDNIYIGSAYNGSTSFMGTSINTTTTSPLILAYAPDGTLRWFHHITGDRADAAADIAVSPIGQVALAVNFASRYMYIDGQGEAIHPEYADVEGETSNKHTGIFSFGLDGNYKWNYYWGYGDVMTEDNANCNALRCSDEGVWYCTGMMTGRYGGKRLVDNTLPGGRNSGVEAVDHQWLQHNTNGGKDCFLITLTRNGELANALRPGGIQYELGMDVALSPDKKSLYLLMHINVRNQPPYTCPDNLFDSYNDFYNNFPERKNRYTLLKVFCPENIDNTATPYTTKYKSQFASSLLVKYAMPVPAPNYLPYFTVNEPYEQSLWIANPQGQVTMFPLGASGDVNFDGTNISGTFINDDNRYVGVLAVDSTALPGEITYYEYDKNTHASLRSNPRNLRYFALTTEENGHGQQEGVENIALDPKAQGRKLLIDGILYIERNGILYSAQGAVVK